MKTIISSLIIASAIIYLGYGFVISQEQNRQMNERMIRLELCYDYSDKNGDYEWRHQYCKGIEEEIIKDQEIKYYRPNN